MFIFNWTYLVPFGVGAFRLACFQFLTTPLKLNWHSRIFTEVLDLSAFNCESELAWIGRNFFGLFDWCQSWVKVAFIRSWLNVFLGRILLYNGAVKFDFCQYCFLLNYLSYFSRRVCFLSIFCIRSVERFRLFIDDGIQLLWRSNSLRWALFLNLNLLNGVDLDFSFYAWLCCLLLFNLDFDGNRSLIFFYLLN